MFRYWNLILNNMKTLLTILLSILSVTLMAQVPQGVGYQGVATDSEGIELVNQAISIRASVLSGSANGTIEWEETHSTTTDTFGLFTLTIGQGTSTTNGAQTSFADIPWGESTHFLKIEMDVTGGSTYSNMGTNQMMSVPYALYAESANINYDSIANYLSGDSTFVTNISNGLGGGNGCDFQYPDGFNGIPVYIDLLSSSYTVPTGKNLYILSTYRLGGSTTILEVNGLRHSTMNTADFQVISAESPLIIKAGDLLSGNDLASGATHINAFGFLIDDLIDPVYVDLLSSSYTVPTGKKLYILSTYRLGGSTTILEVNGLRHSTMNTADFQVISAESPLIIKAGDLLSGNDLASGATHINAFGYLADENYFDGCGEPENPSSIGSNPNSLIYTIDGF
jgi:hypothetical protein